MDIKITADRPTSDIPIAINFNTSSIINFLDLSFSAIDFYQLSKNNEPDNY